MAASAISYSRSYRDVGVVLPGKLLRKLNGFGEELKLKYK